jgi:hypothetical protein
MKKKSWGILSMIAVLLLSLNASAQTGPTSAASATACPVQLENLHVFFVSVQVTNTSKKKIVGLVFHAALADATENWKWLHMSYDERFPLQPFDWNKGLDKDETTKVSWHADLTQHSHGGGMAFVLTRILFADGSTWEDSPDSATCKLTWHDHHKKAFARPVELPRRE